MAASLLLMDLCTRAQDRAGDMMPGLRRQGSITLRFCPAIEAAHQTTAAGIRLLRHVTKVQLTRPEFHGRYAWASCQRDTFRGQVSNKTAKSGNEIGCGGAFGGS